VGRGRVIAVAQVWPSAPAETPGNVLQPAPSDGPSFPSGRCRIEHGSSRIGDTWPHGSQMYRIPACRKDRRSVRHRVELVAALSPPHRFLHRTYSQSYPQDLRDISQCRSSCVRALCRPIWSPHARRGECPDSPRPRSTFPAAGAVPAPLYEIPANRRKINHHEGIM
jgi:hypothetical protein